MKNQEKENKMLEASNIIDNINLEIVQTTMRKIASFQAVVKGALKQGHDYGVIPGTSKPTLLKPGAEKVLMLFGLTSEYELIEKTLDYDKGFFAFTVKCVLYHNGRKITEGLGHSNTKELRYTRGRQQGAYTLANTVLKMAKKRAQVDAVLTVSSLSEIFTQDLEDELEQEGHVQENQVQENQSYALAKAVTSEISERNRINWSAFWAKARSKAKGGLGLTNDQVRELAKERFNGQEFRSLAEVVKSQEELDELFEYLKAKVEV